LNGILGKTNGAVPVAACANSSNGLVSFTMVVVSDTSFPADEVGMSFALAANRLFEQMIVFRYLRLDKPRFSNSLRFPMEAIRVGY